MTSLREQKKLTTTRDLAAAAYGLAREVGYDAVTTDEVAARAGYSRRTFANYYTCKPEAVVDGFFLRIGLRGRRVDELSDAAPIPASFTELIDGIETFVLGALEAPTISEIRTFAQMVHEHGVLEPYVHAALLAFKHSEYHRRLSTAFGHTQVSMFFGAVVGSISGVIEFILGPLALPRDLPEGAPMQSPGATGAVDSQQHPISDIDLSTAEHMIGQAFAYLRHGFLRPNLPATETEQD